MGGGQPRHGMPGLTAAQATSAAQYLPKANRGQWVCGDCEHQFDRHFDNASRCVNGHFTPRSWFTEAIKNAETARSESTTDRDA